MSLNELRERARESWRAEEEELRRPLIVVGTATCGLAAGAGELLEALDGELRRARVRADVRHVGCIGLCYAEPLVDVRLPGRPRVSYGTVDAKKLRAIVRDHVHGGTPRADLALGSLGPGESAGVPDFWSLPMTRPQVRVVLRNCGIIDPDRLDHYVARGGYAGLERALSLKPAAVIEEVKASGLRGRGGGGFPTGRKWELCRAQQGERRYLICNADEGDPGAFMDRSVLEGDPHAVLEGMIIAAWAIGASEGYVYCRAEYPLAVRRLHRAIADAEAAGLLGEHVLGTDFSFRLQVKEGAGAFVCGEETALIGSIEGRRGMPRPRPPFPAERGLFGQPTNINNVETFANVPTILRQGAAWFAGYGTEKSKGTKTFALTGKVRRSGLIEVPMGITLREIVYDVGGGLVDDRRLKAVQSGGPSGGCIPASLLDLPIDYEELTKVGAIMGSGGLVVMDEETCPVDVARYFLQFTESESCGKCVPCRLGTRQLRLILEEVCAGRATERDLALLEQLGSAVKRGSLCGLGQTAPNPVLTTLRYFRDEYAEHVDGTCTAGVCRAVSPTPCQRACPVGMDAASYVALIGWGRLDEALAVMHEDNPFPAVCGRLCPRPCETKCARGDTDQPLAIRALKRFVTDRAMSGPAPVPAPAATPHPERVAIVGGGPCGLSAADELARRGYPVVVFEARRKAGGMLRHAVPDFRMSGKVVEWEVARIASRVEIRTGKALGRDFSLDGLFADGFQAVLLALGAPKGIPFALGGARPGECIDAVDFLLRAKQGKARRPGAKVAVVGWGHLAMDAARTAVRLGASRALLLHPRSEGDVRLSAEELAAAAGEGVEVQPLCRPLEVVRKGGRLAGVRCARMRVLPEDAAGRHRTEPVPGSEFTVPCDAVVVALGHQPDAAALPGEAELRRGMLDNLLTDPVTLETDRRRVFAAGDVVTGGATVIEAIAAGQRAAASIDCILRGGTPSARFKVPRHRRRVEALELGADAPAAARAGEALRPAAERRADFAEAVDGWSEETAVAEARRCLRCDLG